MAKKEQSLPPAASISAVYSCFSRDLGFNPPPSLNQCIFTPSFHQQPRLFYFQASKRHRRDHVPQALIYLLAPALLVFMELWKGAPPEDGLQRLIIQV